MILEFLRSLLLCLPSNEASLPSSHECNSLPSDVDGLKDVTGIGTYSPEQPNPPIQTSSSDRFSTSISLTSAQTGESQSLDEQTEYETSQFDLGLAIEQSQSQSSDPDDPFSDNSELYGFVRPSYPSIENPFTWDGNNDGI